MFTSVANATTAYRCEKIMAKAVGVGDRYTTKSFFAAEAKMTPEDDNKE